MKIAFSSAEDLDATFIIRMPLTNARASVQNATELPLREISPEDMKAIGLPLLLLKQKEQK
nr:hypothetical protein P5640_09160 [Bacillus subtilis]